MWFPAQWSSIVLRDCMDERWGIGVMPHSWPKSFNIGRMQMGPLQEASFHKHRKFTRARHMWLFLNPDWRLLSSHMCTEWPGIHSYAEINDRLFVNPGRNDNIQDILRLYTGSGHSNKNICGILWMGKYLLSKSRWKIP